MCEIFFFFCRQMPSTFAVVSGTRRELFHTLSGSRLPVKKKTQFRKKNQPYNMNLLIKKISFQIKIDRTFKEAAKVIYLMTANDKTVK